MSGPDLATSAWAAWGSLTPCRVRLFSWYSSAPTALPCRRNTSSSRISRLRGSALETVPARWKKARR